MLKRLFANRGPLSVNKYVDMRNETMWWSRNKSALCVEVVSDVNDACQFGVPVSAYEEVLIILCLLWQLSEYVHENKFEGTSYRKEFHSKSAVMSIPVLYATFVFGHRRLDVICDTRLVVGASRGIVHFTLTEVSCFRREVCYMVYPVA